MDTATKQSALIIHSGPDVADIRELHENLQKYGIDADAYVNLAPSFTVSEMDGSNTHSVEVHLSRIDFARDNKNLVVLTGTLNRRSVSGHYNVRSQRGTFFPPPYVI